MPLIDLDSFVETGWPATIVIVQDACNKEAKGPNR